MAPAVAQEEMTTPAPAEKRPNILGGGGSFAMFAATLEQRRPSLSYSMKWKQQVPVAPD